MKKVMELAAREIADGLAREMGGAGNLSHTRPGTIEPVTSAADTHEGGDGLPAEMRVSYSALEARLERVQGALAKLLARCVDDLGRETGAGPSPASSYPNLKYAGHKYSDLDSVLKYVEKDEDAGGVKLVIMNFND